MQNRKVAGGLAVSTGVLCLAASASLSGWLNFGSAVLVEIGAALFLVPAVLWLEGRLTRSIEDTQRSITERYLDSSSVNLLSPNSPWERVHFEFARVATLYPTEQIGLCYPTFSVTFQAPITFSMETAQPGSQVFLYFNAAGQDQDFKVLLWPDGASGREFVASVRRALTAAGVLPPNFPTDEEFFGELRREIFDIPRRYREDSVARRRERKPQRDGR